MNDRVLKLLEKADSSLQTARMLLRESDLEFVSSRIYYAMFYAVEALLANRGLNFTKHSAVHSAFGKDFVKSGDFDARYHKWLLAAFNKRIVSDYEVDCKISKEDAEDLLLKAVEFIDIVKVYLKK